MSKGYIMNTAVTDAIEGPLYRLARESGDAAANRGTNASVAVGDTFTGQISSIRDHDWVKVNLQAGQSYVFTLFGQGGSLVALEDTVLTLRDSEGRHLITNNDMKGGYTTFSLIEFTANSSGTYYLDVSGDVGQTGYYALMAARDVYNLDQIATYLSEVDWGVSTQLRFGFGTSTTVTYNVSGLTSAGRQLAEWALDAWEMMTGLNFSRTYSSDADIRFDDNQSGAFAGPSSYSPNTGIINWSSVNISTSWVSQNGSTIDSYSFYSYLHEIGHALGLGHAGPYNGAGTYGWDNIYRNDSTQLSVMSYFDVSDNTYVSGDNVTFITPMLADLVALHSIYGTPSANTGNTIWGANSNVTGYLGQVMGHMFDGDTAPSSVYRGGAVGWTIFDTGGVDTLDLSTVSVSQRIDIRPEQFSDINGYERNVAIARGTIIEKVIGGRRADNITGNHVGNYIEGNGGRDAISGGGGNDSIYGGRGADSINGGSGNDLLDAGFGNNTIVGGTGTDTAIIAARRVDARMATDGDKILLSWANGNDIFSEIEYFQFTDERVSANTLVAENPKGGSGVPGRTFLGDSGNNYLMGTSGDDSIWGQSGDDTLIGADGDDQMAGSDGNDSVVGGYGDDNLGGGYGNDTMDGGAGNDALGGGPGNDIVRGGAGNDNMGAGAGNDKIYGDAGDDKIGASFGNDYVEGNNGNDQLGGGYGNDTIYGGNGHDRIGASLGDDYVNGGAGNDFLAGAAGNDRLYGSYGRDTINAGSGNDTITGGGSYDVFVFNDLNGGEVDRITDFQDGLDTIRLRGVADGGNGNQGRFDALNITDIFGGVSLSYKGHTIILEGVNSGQLGVDDFLFI